MDDLELRSLLQSADRPRSTTPEERRRLRQALDRHRAVDHPTDPGPSRRSTTDEIASHRFNEASVSSEDRGRLHPPAQVRRSVGRGRDWVVVGTAAAFVVAAFGILALLRNTPEAEPMPAATVPAPRTSDDLRALCAGPLAALDDAVGRWGSVADWTVALDGQPDLATLTAEALTALSSLDPAVQSAVDDVRIVVEEREAFSLPPGPVVEDHARTVRSGLTTVLETVASHDPDGVCELSAIRIELAGG